MVLAPDNQQVLEPPGNKKLAIINESQVARAQKRPITTSLNKGTECIASSLPENSNSPLPHSGLSPKSRQSLMQG